jgi:predicted nucleotidyltransferase component of viral defense system
MLKYPTILQMPAPQLRGYSPESVVAEKLQALVFLGSANSRMKDFYDLWVMAEQFEFDGGVLQKAIIATFQRRKTTLPKETPVGLSNTFAAENQAQWQAFIQRMHLKNIPESFSDVSRVIKGFLVPPLRKSAIREIFEGVWGPGGPWNS